MYLLSIIDKLKKRLLYFLILFGAALNSAGQDIHFTQITRTGFLVNPAFTGMFSGNIQATTNWKDQWQSVDNTFRTYAASAEVSFGKGRARKPTYFGAGLYASKDVSGTVELGTTTIGASFASLIRISRNQRLSVGLQGGSTSIGINPANMQWGSQYSGLSYDPSLFNGEGVDYLPLQFWDFSAGVGYWYSKNDKNVVAAAPQDAKVGIAVYHINRPKNGFSVIGTDRLPMKLVLHGSALFGTPIEDLYWYPNITASFQGPQSQVLFGGLVKYQFTSSSKMTGFGKDIALSGGFNFRVNNVFDAVIPQLFLDIKTFSIGMSYDINVSGLNPASSYRGGFELSLRFTNPDGYTHKNPYRRAVNI